MTTLEKLYLPATDPVTHVTDHFTSKEKLQDWFLAQPHAQPLDFARNMYDALYTLNRMEVERELRHQLNLGFLHNFEIHLPALQILYESNTISTQPKAKSAWNFAKDLYIELGIAFKRSLTEEVNRRFGMSDKQVARLIALCLDLNQRLLLTSFQNYHPVPEHTWQDCHTLFYYALQHKLLDEAPKEDELQIVPLYKESLLLGLCDPYSLLNGEILQVKNWLQKLGGYAALQSVSNLSDPSGYFLIKLDEDNPPQFMGHRPVDLNGYHQLLLNCFDVVRRIYRELPPLEKVAASASTYYRATQHIDLLRRLIRSWGIAPQRVFNRMRNNAKVELVSELSTVHRILANTKNLRLTPEENTNENDEVTLDNLESPSHLEMSLPLVNSQEEHISQWKVINVSAGGYALGLESDEINHIAVGRIVILKSDSGDRWNVAAVRWVKQNAHIEIGLQLLAPDAEPILIRPVIHSAGAIFETGLLLPAVQELRQPASIVAPAGFFAPLREFEILRGPHTLTARSIRRMTQGLGVDQFEFITPAEVEALLEMPLFDNKEGSSDNKVA